MLKIFDGDALTDDLDKLDDGHLIDAFLTQISESEEAMWELSKWPGENANPFFNVKGIQTLQSQGYNIYRIRPLTSRLKKYRILYAYDAPHDDFYILAIVIKRPPVLPPECLPNEFYNYEPNHPITVRVCDEYSTLNLPRIC